MLLDIEEQTKVPPKALNKVPAISTSRLITPTGINKSSFIDHGYSHETLNDLTPRFLDFNEDDDICQTGLEVVYGAAVIEWTMGRILWMVSKVTWTYILILTLMYMCKIIMLMADLTRGCRTYSTNCFQCQLTYSESLYRLTFFTVLSKSIRVISTSLRFVKATRLASDPLLITNYGWSVETPRSNVTEL